MDFRFKEQFFCFFQAFEGPSIDAALRDVYSRTLLVSSYSRTMGEPVPKGIRCSIKRSSVVFPMKRCLCVTDMEDRAARMKEEFVAIEEQLTPFLSCMISVGRERQEGEVITGLERKTVKVAHYA